LERQTPIEDCGSSIYFNDKQATSLLKNLRNRFVNIKKVFIGNLPDSDLADEFYKSQELKEKYMDDPQSSIGVWRSKSQFRRLATECGWQATFSDMPENFYASHYRYDVILFR
jgi:hypothetical protein